MNKTRVQIAREDGFKQGFKEGRLEERFLQLWQSVVTDILEARFAPLPDGFAEWLAKRDSIDALKPLLMAAGTAPSLDEFRSRAGW